MIAPLPARATEGVANAVVATRGAEAADEVDVGLPPVWVTLKVYDVPAVRPVTVQLWAPVITEAALTVQKRPPGFDVTV